MIIFVSFLEQATTSLSKEIPVRKKGLNNGEVFLKERTAALVGIKSVECLF